MSSFLSLTSIRSYLGELTASFIFGFTVYSAIVSSTLTEQTSAPLIVATAVGFSGIAIIFSFGDIAAAHFNPAITLAAILFGQINLIMGLMYILFQVLGFILACFILPMCFPEESTVIFDMIRPSPVGDTSTINLIVTEMMLTGILTFVAFAVAIHVFKKKKEATEDEKNLPENEYDKGVPDKTRGAPVVIGLTLGFLALLGGASSGGAFNPGIVCAPVILSGNFESCVYYWFGEFLGAIIGAALQFFLL